MAISSCAMPPEVAASRQDFNTATLAAIQAMPEGGGYSGSDATKNRLIKAYALSPKGFTFHFKHAQPSFCSSATYLVFLHALQQVAPPSPPVAQTLLVTRDQQDGHGVFGRWNANGPGCAKLVADLGCGVNFTSWQNARAGDFMKIWWTREIGSHERGHHVVYLGHDEQQVHFWSSNLPNGYGSKSVPITSCQRVLFTRITKPEHLSRAASLPDSDPWLTAMLKKRFLWDEVAHKCQITR